MVKKLERLAARAVLNLLLVLCHVAADAQDAHPRVTTVAVVDHQTDQYNQPDDRVALLHADWSGGFSETMFNDAGSGSWRAVAWPNPLSAMDGISGTGRVPAAMVARFSPSGRLPAGGGSVPVTAWPA